MPLKQTLGDVKQLEIKNSDGPGEGDELCDIAARLAAGAITAEPVRINFLNGHSAAKTAVIPKQWWSRIAMGAAVIILLLGLYVYGWYADSSAVAEYKQNLDAMSKNVEVAEEMIEQVGHAKQWFSRQPEHLENLRELTLMFPPSSDIWLTSLAVDPSMDQIIAGRATHEYAILDVVDKLKANPSFRDINLQYIRKMGKNTDVMTFAVKYNYRREQ